MDPLDYDLTYPKNRALWSNISGNSGKIKVVYKKAVDDYQLKSSILDRNDDSWISGSNCQGQNIRSAVIFYELITFLRPPLPLFD
jgi:hypothetical protein